MQPAASAIPKPHGRTTRSNSRAAGDLKDNQGNTQPEDIGSGNGITPTNVDDNESRSLPAEVTGDNSTVTRPSFSPLTIRGNSVDRAERLSSTGIVEVVETALEASQASMIEVMRKEMQSAVAAAVKVALSQSPITPCNPSDGYVSPAQNINWPHDLPPRQTDTRHVASGRHNSEFQNCDGRDCFNRSKYPYINKWGIKFDATPKTPQIEDFLFRIERLRRSYGCSERELLDGFHHLLEGRASQWYWGQIRQYPNMNWENLKVYITHEFQRFQSNLDVMRQIMDRKQGRDESATQYIDAITSLRTQLREPLKDFEVIDILKAGLKPKLAHLTFSGSFYSVEQFRNEVRKAEEFLEREPSQRIRPNAPSRMLNEIFESETDEMVNEVDELRFRSKPAIATNKDSSRCWNCGDHSHVFKQCNSSKRSLFCFRCGTPGVTAPQCNNCRQQSRAGNSSKTESVSTQTVD